MFPVIPDRRDLVFYGCCRGVLVEMRDLMEMAGFVLVMIAITGIVGFLVFSACFTLISLLT
jgi:hypothetical protein